MPTMTQVLDTALPPAGTTMIPNAHEVQLAAESRRSIGALAQTGGDYNLTLSGDGGETTQLRIPSVALQLLFAALSEMACGNGVSLLPLHSELTTQQAADLLNVSRPYLVGLLEKGEMPFRLVGNQRRVRLQDVVAYKARSDVDRRAALGDLLLQLAFTGLYQARWSAEIDDEWKRNLLAARPELAGRIVRTHAVMRLAMPDALVTEYAHLIDGSVLA